MTLLASAEAILPELIALRRELHAHPEIGLHLPFTQKRVLEALEGLPLEITLGTETTSIVAVLRGAQPGPAVLLRGDMDGLPITEQTGLEYASKNGNMHACGHDLHTAGLVGAAKLLAERRDEISGSVIFMFQPGEEGYNGASVMIKEGVLEAAGERPIAAYGLHVGPGPRGVLATLPGPLLAGSSELHITVHGRGGHGSMPHGAADPVVALAELVTQLQVMVTRKFDVFEPVVISVTRLSAGDAVNVIPASASLSATVRTVTQTSLDALPGFIEQLASGIAAAHSCTAEVHFDTQYIPTVNDPVETEFAIDALRQEFGDERVIVPPHGVMGSEDFSYVLHEIPGTFYMLSATPDGVDPMAATNHSPLVQFDDQVLATGAASLAKLALARLAQ